MSVSNKLRALLNLTDHKPPDLADGLGISVQAVRNKFNRDSFSASDLIKISNTLNCELIFKTQDGQTINLTMDDLKIKEEKKS